MKAFVLAAGYGQRMRPITDSLPKPLLPVGNLPLIGYALNLLRFHNIRDVIINTHHLGGILREELGEGEKWGLNLSFSEEDEILGTGGALRKMKHELQDGTFILLNSDSIIDLDLDAVLATHRKSGNLVTLVLRKDPHQKSFGEIEVDQERRVRRIVGSGDFEGELESYMFTGVHIIEPALLDHIPSETFSCIIRGAYTHALLNDEKIGAHIMDGFFADAGTPERYLNVHQAALGNLFELKHVSPFANLTNRGDKGSMIGLGEGVELGEGAKLVAPVILGSFSKVGSGCVVGPNVVTGEGVILEKESHIRDSVIMAHTKLEPRSDFNSILASKNDRLDLKS